MADYKAMYFRLFNRVSDAIALLQLAQQEGEEAAMRDSEAPIFLLEAPAEEAESDEP